MEEVKPLLYVKPRAYFRRWWVLCYFSLACMFTTCSWNLWGPITESVKYGFGWDDSVIVDILNIGRLAMFLCIIPVSYLIDMKGIRYGMVTSNALLLVGYILRCLINLTTSTWPALLGQFMIGCGNVIGYSGPSAMSVAWFPHNERATATSLAVMSTYIGLGVAYVINPLLVSTPIFGQEAITYHNFSQSGFTDSADHDLSLATNLTNGSIDNVVLNKNIIQEETMTLMYIETGITAVFVIVGMTLVPNAPPTPPSHSASATRMGYAKVFLHLMRSGFLCLLVLYTGMVIGMYASWVVIFGITFEHLGITQACISFSSRHTEYINPPSVTPIQVEKIMLKEAGWLGFASLITSSFVGFISARFSDVCARRMKTILISMMVVSSLMYLWVSLLCSQYIDYSKEQLYVSTILACAFLNGCVPLLYEQICNSAFPIPEGIIVGISALVTMLGGIFYMLPISLVEFEDNSWLEWSLLVVCVVGCIVILITPQKNGRADLDVSIRVFKTGYYQKLESDQKDLLIAENKVPENA